MTDIDFRDFSSALSKWSDAYTQLITSYFALRTEKGNTLVSASLLLQTTPQQVVPLSVETPRILAGRSAVRTSSRELDRMLANSQVRVISSPVGELQLPREQNGASHSSYLNDISFPAVLRING